MNSEHSRILCVVEDPKSLKAMVYLLRSDKHHVIAASTVNKTMEVIRKESSLDLVIFDYAPTLLLAGNKPTPKLENHQGNELGLAETVREKFPDVPILFMLSQNDKKVVDTLSGIENSYLLYPPYEPTYFLFVVKTGLNGGYLLTNL